MSETKEKRSGKALGKAFFAVTAIIFVVIFGASWYIGGQDTALTKYYSAITSGDLKSYRKATGGSTELTEAEKSSYKEKCRSFFTDSPEFSELEDTDVIYSDFKITERRMLSPTRWECTMKTSYYSSGMSLTLDNVVLTLSFSRGKWVINE
ncbi:MAG: hypothetical protein ACI4SF_16390 [Oscillospiraceae bacterium]